MFMIRTTTELFFVSTFCSSLFETLRPLSNFLLGNKDGRMHRSDAEAGDIPFSKKTQSCSLPVMP